jgi:hypothetical protein
MGISVRLAAAISEDQPVYFIRAGGMLGQLFWEKPPTPIWSGSEVHFFPAGKITAIMRR